MTRDTVNKLKGVQASMDVVKKRIAEIKDVISNEPKPMLKELHRNSLKANKEILRQLTDLAYELDTDLAQL